MRLNIIHPKRFRVYDEPIEMTQRRHGYFPRVFRWHGHYYHVHAIERCWTTTRRRIGEGRLFFLVRCAEGTFELYQDLMANTWHVGTAQWLEENLA